MAARTANWQFGIDVGGTFTDCLAIAPDGETRIIKVLSSGRTHGHVLQPACSIEAASPGEKPRYNAQTSLHGSPSDFWVGYQLRWLVDGHASNGPAVVVASSPNGELTWEVAESEGPPSLSAGSRFELSSTEGAPLLCIRQALRLRLADAVPRVSVRLGTTRGTNALLTRTGARVGLVTTRGFRDVLLIANQDRPKLFELAIEKPQPLFHAVVEIDERLAADGTVLESPQDQQIQTALADLNAAGCESVAICLLHAFANPAHEAQVARVAEQRGLHHVSVSSRLSPLIKIVPRGDTTVMDAYLNPLLRDYVADLQARLPGSDVRLMTSSGGLVSAERFTGKESVLSGPAGGVIGFSQAAQQAGYARAIGFDMGGTSSDVSRFDGDYEYEFETMKAGVRIVTPMLAIETVAAGGGSVCGFDGVKIYVGPASAGADPGPACYGRGGPLTVTDCNVFLGRIPADCFPFALDLAAIRDRIDHQVEQIVASPMGRHYSPEELASGFLDIANATMARAIRNVSVAKGYDPSSYVLVPFGGAGGQHACALARLLGMTKILAHPWAGILSAYGIGQAPVRRFRQLSILQPYSEQALRGLESTLNDLDRQAREEVLAEGVPAERVSDPIVSLELRYRGVEAAISVGRPPDGDYAKAYEERHQQLYGYVRPGSPLEIVTLRVEVVGHSAATPHSAVAPSAQPMSASNTQRRMWTGQGFVDAPVYRRDALTAGQLITGPAIIAEPTSTLVIDPGFAATVGSEGEIAIVRTGDAAGPAIYETPAAAVAVDPVQLELFHQTFTSFAEQMGVTLRNTSVSTNVKERLDFSCAIFDRDGGLVVNAPHIPVHLGAMSETVRCILRDNPDLAPGDVYVTNDPFRGGSHLPDVTVVTPVHDPETRELLFLTASRAHHAEIGGIVPGSMPPFSKNLGEEGVLIRNFRLILGGNSREDDLASLLKGGPYPSRNVQDNLSDIQAQVAANQRGAQLLLQLVRERGAATVRAYMGYLQDAAAAAMSLALEGIPDGVYRFVDYLDDGSPIAVAIEVSGSTASIDFTGTGPVLATNLNANRAIVTAAVMYTLRCLLAAPARQRGVSPSDASATAPSTAAPQLPLNGGVLRPITLVLPTCLLNPPEHENPALCPAMVGGNVETSQRVVDVLLGALGLAAASQGTMNNLTFGDATFGYYETICGGSGAVPYARGTDAVHTHMTNTRLTDPEILERRFPVRLREFTIRRGSGGEGQFAGGDGVRRTIEFLRPVRLSLLTQRRGPYAPYGCAGGKPGQLGSNVLKRASGEQVDCGAAASRDVLPGDVLTIETPGGGGWGSAS